MPGSSSQSRSKSSSVFQWENEYSQQASEPDQLNDEIENYRHLNDQQIIDGYFAGLDSISFNDNIVHRINKKISLDSILNHFGISFEQTYSPSGWSQKSICPFKDHNDSSPSFYVNQNDNCFNCFGCSRAGGPVQFVAYYLDLTFNQALDRLSEFNPEIIEEAEANHQVSLESFKDSLFEFAEINSSFLNKHQYSPESFEFASHINMAFDFYIQNCLKNKEFNKEAIDARIRLYSNKLNAKVFED